MSVKGILTCTFQVCSPDQPFAWALLRSQAGDAVLHSGGYGGRPAMKRRVEVTRERWTRPECVPAVRPLPR
jgi:hypothetical protein